MEAGTQGVELQQECMTTGRNVQRYLTEWWVEAQGAVLVKPGAGMLDRLELQNRAGIGLAYV